MVRSPPVLAQAWVKTLALCVCGLPMVWLWGRGFAGLLGANPAEALIRGLGDWTLRFLCLTLAVTPLRKTLVWTWLARWRRGLGLWTFAYGATHLLAYAWFDMGFEPQDIVDDIAQRPFILVGMLALGLMLPLAATSFNRAIKGLGAQRWQALHRLVYGVAGLAVLHFYWMRAGKNHFAEVHVYAVVLASLMLWRWWLTKRSHQTQAGA